MTILLGIAAILAGIIFIVATHTGTDYLLEALGIFTQPNEGFHATWMIVTATIYRSIYSIAGGYITAALAPSPKMRYAAILGLIGIVASTLGAIRTISMGITQTWYPIALVVLALPCTWFGGKLRTS